MHVELTLHAISLSLSLSTDCFWYLFGSALFGVTTGAMKSGKARPSFYRLSLVPDPRGPAPFLRIRAEIRDTIETINLRTQKKMRNYNFANNWGLEAVGNEDLILYFIFPTYKFNPTLR